MKLVANGDIGYLYDQALVDELTTKEDIEKEIARITLTNYEPSVRDNNTVVTPESYIEFLKDRMTQVESVAVVVEKKVDDHFEIQRRDDIIEQLLERVENQGSTVSYSGLIPVGVKDSPVVMAAPIKAIVDDIHGELGIKVFTNAATARGLLGDKRAEMLIDELYGEGEYAKFLEALQQP